MIKALASGSTGNAYLLDDILIECGISYDRILQKGGYKRPKACIVTHYHGDHAKYVHDIAKVATPIYASAGTFEEVDPDNRIRRAYRMHHGERYQIRDWIVTPFNSDHCFGAFYYVFQKDNRKLLFSTDNAFINEDHEDLTEIYIEANYSEDELKEAEHLKDSKRVEAMRAHMSVEDCIDWLKRQDLSYTDRITLLHLSMENSNLLDYIKRIERATGIPTFGAMEK